MGEWITDIIKVKFIRACADVPFRVPVCPKDPVYAGDKHVSADIELPILIKEGFIHVLLDDVSYITPVAVFLPVLDDILYLVQFLTYLDAIPSIGVLSWFNYPDILSLSFHPFTRVGLLDRLFQLTIIFLKRLILFIIKALCDVESKRQIVEYVHLFQLVMVLHIVK